jgi:hypothetical protein
VKSLRLAIATIAGIAVVLVTTAVPAHAQILDVTCAGTDSIVISPGLLFTPQTVTITGTKIFAPCLSTDSSLLSGSTVAMGTVVRSCDLTADPHPGSAVISWNNNQTSTFSYNVETTYSAGQNIATFTGNITAGEFSGDTAVMVSTGLAPNPLACLAPPGVTNLYGTVTLEITSL